MENKKGQTTLLNIIIGILLIGGGVLYLLGQSLLGAVIAGFGIFMEILVNFIRSVI